jgi:hypothetical protein
MKLTDEQLAAIKLKIETDKIFPAKAIKGLHPGEDTTYIKEQLFAKYDKKDLRSHGKAAKAAKADQPAKPAKASKESK